MVERPPAGGCAEAGEQPGGFGFPADELGAAAFADHDGSPSGQVELVDVEREDLVRARRGLIQQPPEGLLAQGVLGVQERGQLGRRDRAPARVVITIGSQLSSLQAGGGRAGCLALTGGAGEERTEGRDDTVP